MKRETKFRQWKTTFNFASQNSNSHFVLQIKNSAKKVYVSPQKSDQVPCE